MTKYEIFKNEITFPIREKNKIKSGCTLLSDNQFPEKLEEYIDLDSAKKELSKYVSSIELWVELYLAIYPGLTPSLGL